MIPKEKALKLIEKFECYVDYQGDDCFNEREKMLINAKRCALIAVDEIINLDISHYHLDYWWWQEVKQEIELL
jgi:hypothetical protein